MATRPAELLAGLKSNTDLASLIERVCREDRPWVVVPAATLAAWQQRDPTGWAKVSAWLAAKGVTIVTV